MKYWTIALLLPLAGLTMGWFNTVDQLPPADEDAYVEEVLIKLGKPKRADNSPYPADIASVELGLSIVTEGIGADDQRQSKHFVCTSCHNLVPEDPDFLSYDPEKRLAFAEENDLPFLPGTTLYGAVNRMTYYNDDYEKKYGDLVKSARNDLREAVQLCATECAQGRPLSEMEMASVMAYLRTIGLRLKDLKFHPAEMDRINSALSGQGDRNAAMELIKSKFRPASPATFVLPPEDRKAGYPTAAGRPEVGAQLFKRSCLHCHENQRYSFFDIQDDNHSRSFLSRHFPKYTRYSTYQVARYGTSPIPGKKAYMPHYTEERMSDRQIEDIRAYLADEVK